MLCHASCKTEYDLAKHLYQHIAAHDALCKRQMS